MFDWIVALMGQGGYAAIAFLMLFENVFPPIPSELVMPLAGFLAARGTLTLIGVVVAGTAGAVAGALFWYWIGRKLGLDRLRALAGRHGHWLTIDGGSIDRSAAWFERHGSAAVFFGRMIPGIRTFISVPAGVSGMPLARFIAWTTAGSAIWTGVLTALGYVLNAQYARVQTWLDPITYVVLAAILGTYLWRLVRRKRRRGP